MVELSDRELTGRIIGAALRVHQVLGPGFLESVYEEALCLELEALEIPYERQRTIPIRYRGQKVGEHRPDLVVGGRVIVELKAIRELDNVHFATVRSYMRASGLASAMILNFATMPLTIKRVALDFHQVLG
jgi:GxxExxY protein